eukprot:TRINITY_DN5305_c0_g3_i1.p2 TRINITY_DN5305_c0_g3~~TRINITY_DN5305_c0_g3_i1.p2  ORF type:complete len:137 (-),score=15.15 TRINITY_DN5305_c0_g3_i1:187-597(-)
MMKEQCLREPEKYLWAGTMGDGKEMRNIFYAIDALEYYDRPNYTYIREQLLSLLNIERKKEFVLDLPTKQVVIKGKRKLNKLTDLDGQPVTKCLTPNHGPVFKIEKSPTSPALFPDSKDPFKLIIDSEYYRKIYAI